MGFQNISEICIAKAQMMLPKYNYVCVNEGSIKRLDIY